jgi:hypothetical protein
MTGSGREPGGPSEPTSLDYEPPRVERVLTPAELEREVLYAGLVVSPGTDG